jgi:membrane-associated phospholipid phosphatase
MHLKLRLILLFSVLIQAVHAQSFDYRLLKSLHQKETSFRTSFAKTLSASAGPVMIATPVLTLGYGYIENDSAAKRNGLVMLGSIGINGILTMSTKWLVKRERPYVSYTDISNRVETGPYSFPSGHTSSAFATATALSLAYPKWYVIAPSFLWAGGVAWSRMYLGVHFPSDIFGGIVIGAGSSFLAWWIDRRLSS